MFCYHVGSGNNLTHQNIVCDTVRLYARDVSDGLKQVNSNNVDIRYAHPRDKAMAPVLTGVFKELSRYEKVKNRKEPTTIPMVKQAKTEAAELGTAGRLGKVAALADWGEVNMYVGARKTEWAQNEAYRADPTKYERRTGLEEARAFNLGDFDFFDSHQRPMTLANAVAAPHRVHFINLTFRWQKNNQHGEKKKYARNLESNDGLCCVSAFLRIIDRFITLFGINDLSTPVACYLDAQTGRPKLITTKVIEEHLRHLASVVYNLDPKNPTHEEILKKWTSHSYRIGATVILHELGYDFVTIQFLLRWRSDSFKDYLRATPAISIQHTRDLNRAMLNLVPPNL